MHVPDYDLLPLLTVPVTSMPSIAYRTIVASQGLKREFNIDNDITDDELAALHGGGEECLKVMAGITSKCTKTMLAAEPWVCGCGAGTPTRMVNVPGFKANPPGGGPPVIADVCPVPICDDPACEAGASQMAKEVSEHIHLAQMAQLKAAEVWMCAQCEKTRPANEPGAEPMPQCAQCQAVRYCDRVCQKSHWKVSRSARSSRLSFLDRSACCFARPSRGNALFNRSEPLPLFAFTGRAQDGVRAEGAGAGGCSPKEGQGEGQGEEMRVAGARLRRARFAGRARRGGNRPLLAASSAAASVCAGTRRWQHWRWWRWRWWM